MESHKHCFFVEMAGEKGVNQIFAYFEFASLRFHFIIKTVHL